MVSLWFVHVHGPDVEVSLVADRLHAPGQSLAKEGPRDEWRLRSDDVDDAAEPVAAHSQLSELLIMLADAVAAGLSRRIDIRAGGLGRSKEGSDAYDRSRVG